MGKTIISTVDVPRGHKVVRTWRIVEQAESESPTRFVAVGIGNEDDAQYIAALLRDGDPHASLLVVEHIEIIYDLDEL